MSRDAPGKAIKYEEVYLHRDGVESAAKASLTQRIRSPNSWRSHNSTGRR
jgi:hypothetical protein